jgi:AhpD family alkylhydroperoxidase
MEPRISFYKAAPGVIKAMRGIEEYIHSTTLEGPLIELVKMRASQINGCAYCLDMHSKDARAAGETEQRLYSLPAWRESPFYTDRERAALEWTEALTLIADTHAPDVVYEQVRVHFDEEELVNLTLVITSINSWNRFAIGFRAEPGTYQPQARTGAASGARHS